MFECSGGNAEYHLNEGDQIRQWMKGPGAKAVAEKMHEEGLQESAEPKLEKKLPPMKGSRQHVWLELAKGFVKNYRYYYAYLETLRIRANPNKVRLWGW